MQKNGFDHWVRSRFLFRYQIFCDSYPYLPIRAKTTILPSGSFHRYCVTLPSEETYNEFSARLRHDQITYHPLVERRREFWVHLVEPDENDSLSIKWFWRLIRLAVLSVLSICTPVNNLWRIIIRVFITRI